MLILVVGLTFGLQPQLTTAQSPSIQLRLQLPQTASGSFFTTSGLDPDEPVTVRIDLNFEPGTPRPRVARGRADEFGVAVIGPVDLRDTDLCRGWTWTLTRRSGAALQGRSDLICVPEPQAPPEPQLPSVLPVAPIPMGLPESATSSGSSDPAAVASPPTPTVATQASSPSLAAPARLTEIPSGAAPSTLIPEASRTVTGATPDTSSQRGREGWLEVSGVALLVALGALAGLGLVLRRW